MKYTVAFARLREHKHLHPERTAYKSFGAGFNFDYICQTWTNRTAMLKACDMSDTGELGNRPWKPLVKET